MRMHDDHPSRRMVLLAGTAALRLVGASGDDGAPVLTAGTVVERIKAGVRVHWRQKTVDNLIAG